MIGTQRVTTHGTTPTPRARTPGTAPVILTLKKLALNALTTSQVEAALCDIKFKEAVKEFRSKSHLIMLPFAEFKGQPLPVLGRVSKSEFGDYIGKLILT